MKKKKSTLVINKTSSVTSPELLRVNTATSLIRNDEMEGRAYTVVPMVMMVEGVHAGSSGPLYYPAEELAKVPGVWNHKPVVVYHPQINGQGVSACDPEILTTYKIGVIMNTKFEDGKLKAEAWLEADRIEKVDNRIAEAIANQTMLELSTGVFTENEAEAGEWNGEAYTHIARNYRPDHLAVLPDQKGACSIEDGAGFIRNQSGALQIEEGVLKTLARKLVGYAAPFVTNVMSYGNIREQLHGQLKEKFKGQADKSGWVDIWIEDVYDDFIVYEFQSKLWKLDYSKSEATATLEGDPVEVRRVTEYQTVDGSFVGNQANLTTNKKNDTAMNKKKIVDALIANHGWTEEDRETLMGMSEEQLGRMKPTENKEESKPAVPAAVKPTDNKQEAPKPLTYDEIVANASPEVRDMLKAQQSAYEGQKTGLITRITANKKNIFSEEQLRSKSLDELQGIAALAAVPQERSPRFDGNADVPVDNAGEEEPLVAATMDFGNS